MRTIHRHKVKALDSLCSCLILGSVQELHDQLLSSNDHLDRELAIWRAREVV